MLAYIEQILSAIIILGLFIGWLGLIVRRHHMLGPAAPLHDRQWFLDIYRRGWQNLSRCWWALWLPLFGLIFVFAERKITNVLVLKLHPEYQKMQQQYESQTLANGLASFMKALPSALPRNLLESANKVTDAVFSSLSSYAFMALFLFAVMFILLKAPNPSGGSTENIDLKKKRLLGIASGIIGIVLFLSFTLLRFFVDRPNVLVSLLFPLSLLYSFVPAFAFATFLHAFDAADRGERESFATAVDKGAVFFQVLLLFFLFTAGIGFIRPLFMILALGPPFWLWQIGHFLIEISILSFLIMVSLIPALIVIHRLSLKSAIDKCIALWVSQWKNLLAFIAAGALLLLIPVMLEGTFWMSGGFGIIGIGGFTGWSMQVIKISLGAFLLSSFVVFLRELQEQKQESVAERS